MSDDVYTETSTEGWFSRLGKSFMGVLVGFVVFALAFPLLWWNEGHLVQTEAGYAEAKTQVVEVKADQLDPGANGKLVHLAGRATTNETLADDQFGVSANAIKLVRRVEMYQWEEEERTEKEKQLGGGEKTVKTYTYKKTWSPSVIDSSGFKKPDGHRNPGSMPFESRTWVAEKTTLGAYTLSAELVDQIDHREKLSVGAPPAPNLEKADPNAGAAAPDANDAPAAPTAPPADLSGLQVVNGEYYRGTPNDPQIGDVKVSFAVVKPTDVSVLAKLNGETFEGWTSSNGTGIDRLMLGIKSTDAMFEQLAAELSMWTWICRFIGFVMMFIGLSAIAGPLGVLADVIPFVGDLVRMGTGLFAGVIAAFFALVTIAAAWLFYRPLYGLALLAVAVAIVFVARSLFAPKRELPAQFSPEGA